MKEEAQKKLQSEMIQDKEEPNPQNQKKIMEFSCYIRIEKNGIDLTKSLNIINICQTEILENIVENKYEIVIKHTKPKQTLLRFWLNQVSRIFDKFMKEEKMTINISKSKSGNENYVVFLYKTNEQVLQNFKSILYRLVDEEKNISHNNGTAKYTNDAKKQIEVIDLKDPCPNTNDKFTEAMKNRLAKKKKFKEFMKDPDKFISHQEELVKQQEQLRNQKITKPTAKVGFLNLPIESLDILLSFLDYRSKYSIPVLNHQLKNQFDEVSTNLHFRPDTPSSMIVRLMERFKNLNILKFGTLKNLKNETFKSINNINLSCLVELDISNITVLNDQSINKLFNLMKDNLKVLSFNFLLEGVTAAINYLPYFVSIEEISISSRLSRFLDNYTETKFNSVLDQIRETKNFFSPTIFRNIKDVIKGKSLKRFSIFLWNFYLEEFPVFDCGDLKIDFFLVHKLEDLCFLPKIKYLNQLELGHLGLIIDSKLNQIASTPEDKLFDLESIRLEKISYPLFENSIEIFTSILSKLTNIKVLKLGSFPNNETLQLISLHLTNLIELRISSWDITDEYFSEILKTCTLLERIDLRGCNKIDGTCFVSENVELPSNFRHLKTTIINFNVNVLLDLLKNKGITVENYLHY